MAKKKKAKTSRVPRSNRSLAATTGGFELHHVEKGFGQGKLRVRRTMLRFKDGLLTNTIFLGYSDIDVLK